MVSAHLYNHSEQNIFTVYKCFKRDNLHSLDNIQMIVVTDVYHKLTDKLHKSSKISFYHCLQKLIAQVF